MLFGWKGKILRIDLTRGNCSVENLPDDVMRDYIGGRGAGVKIFFDEVDPRIDPLSPENKIIFCTGPLTGTGVPSGGRFVAVSKSPLTGTISNPNCGGCFGANLKYAGYDFLIVEGKSPEPVYLSIHNDQVKIKPALHLWGKGTTETENAIRDEDEGTEDPWGKNILSVAMIGPAGENLVKFASIMSDGGRALGRGGLGAVMGSKNLKAIAVKGTGEVYIADVEGFKKAFSDFMDEAIANGELKKRSSFGTWGLLGRAQATGTLSAQNFQLNYLESFRKYENPAVVREQIAVRDEGCFGCPFRCSKRTQILDPAYPGTSKGPEHETIALLGANCGITDIIDICKANYICNELGMDTITAGATISCAMELFEKGYLTEKEIGYSLNFGNADATVELLKAAAFRQGFGALLAEGGHAVAESCGHPELYMGIKKMGMPAWHPQGRFKGSGIIGLQYATSNVGGCHTRSTLTFNPKSPEPEPLAQWVKHYQDLVAVVDAGVLCWIIYHGPLWEEKPLVWLQLVTGNAYTQDELLLIGERTWNLERLFNLSAGFSAKDDSLPPRMLTEAPFDGNVVNLAELLDAYYRIRGWDENGIPKPETLDRLGLSEWKVKVS